MSDLSAFDLNLLVVLDVLLREGGVTAAARRLGMSQSAVSHALARLRDTLDDPLLVRDGNRMWPTPRAEALRPELDRVLSDVRGLLSTGVAFDAAQTRRRFVVAASDLLAPMVPRLVAALAGAAPYAALAVRGHVRPHDPELATGGCDLALLPLPEEAPGIVARRLGELEFAVIARAEHPFLVSPTIEQWCAAPHVAVQTPSPGSGYVAATVAREGLQRQIALQVPSFLLAVHAVAETDLLFTAPRPLLAPLAARLGLGLADPPFATPVVAVSALWHERFTADPAHRWFREWLVHQVGPWLVRHRSGA